jgi:hypothetical protein
VAIASRRGLLARRFARSPFGRELRETVLVRESQSSKDSRMDNPIINALVPFVAAFIPRRLTLDTYGPNHLPVGVVIFAALEDGTENEIGRCEITTISRAQFVSWFSEATIWLDRQLKAKGL